MPAPDYFRSQCRWLRSATIIVFVGLCLILGLIVAMGVLAPAPPGLHLEDNRIEIWQSFINLLPAVGYLWALWAVQRAMGDVAAGRMFDPAVARAMRHIGAGVLAGALFKIFAVTNLSRWISGSQGSYVYFDLAAIVLCVVGAALILLARLLDRARALETELEGIL